MSLLADPRLRLLVNELVVHRRLVLAVFVAVNLLALGAAFAWPKGYTAYTTVLVSEKNIIQPLMQGAAVPTQAIDRARIAREIVGGRKVLNQVIDLAGWSGPETTLQAREKLIESLSRRITVSTSGSSSSLIQIEFRDSSAERAFRTVEALGDVFIRESIAAKAAESAAAFAFIDQQTQEYHDKLMKMEDRLKEFRVANIDVTPTSQGDTNTRISALQTRIEQSTQELKEAETKRWSLEKQLSGEAESSSAITREGQYRARISELQTQLDSLRLSYHDTYPDIVRIRHQINDLNEVIAAERQRRESVRASGVAIPVNEEAVVQNPMYQQLKRDFSQTQIQIDMLRARIREAKQQLVASLDRSRRAQGGEAALAELTRDYQVNRDIYQDLLRRRENARVSMNMDRENQGLTFKIQEPARLPTHPGLLSFWHFLALGLVLSLAIPPAMLYGMIQLDPRLRLSAMITTVHPRAVVVAIPRQWTEKEAATLSSDLEWSGVIMLGTVLIVGIMTLLNFIGVL